MIYVVYGSELKLIDKYINEIINKNKIESISKYDLDSDTIYSFLEDCSYMDLFTPLKAVIVSNCSFLVPSSRKKDEEETIENQEELELEDETGFDKKELEELERYINKENDKTFLFLVINKEKLDERKKLVKLLRSKCEVHDFNSLSKMDLPSYINNILKVDGYKIEKNAEQLLISYFDKNTSFLDSELDKLKMYKLEDKIITEDDIKNVVSKLPDNDIFKLVDAVILNKKDMMFKHYKNLLNMGIDSMQMIGGIYAQLHLIYQVNVLKSRGYTKDKIASYLGIHIYRVELIINSKNKYDNDKIAYLIDSLFKIDLGIKDESIDRKRALETFFLEI